MSHRVPSCEDASLAKQTGLSGTDDLAEGDARLRNLDQAGH